MEVFERFMVNEIQWQWVRRGTQSGRSDILSHPDYIHATSYNCLFPAPMRRLKDYWHLVEYPRLLAIYQNTPTRCRRRALPQRRVRPYR